MAPTILIIGATGNTGRKVVETLPGLIKNSPTLSSHRIIALSRTKDSPTAQRLATIPGVEVIEYNWIEINAAWLREHDVVRIFIASHNEPSQFAEEGQLHNEALRAGVKYVVRISTTAANVHPNFGAYYTRTHWALETMLATPEFSAMQFTSLQPNVFFSIILAPAVQFVKEFRNNGKQSSSLKLLLDESTPTGVINADDVGVFAAHLLAQEKTDAHNGKKYVLNGPEDTTGARIVALVEREIGEKVQDVKFANVDFIHQWADSIESGSKNIIRSIVNAPVTGWEGKASAETTSPEVRELAMPRGTLEGTFKEMLG